MVRSGPAHSTPGERARSRPGLWGDACENFAAPAFGADSTARLKEGARLAEGDGRKSIPFFMLSGGACSATDATPPTLSTPPIARPRSPDVTTSVVVAQATARNARFEGMVGVPLALGKLALRSTSAWAWRGVTPLGTVTDLAMPTLDADILSR